MKPSFEDATPLPTPPAPPFPDQYNILAAATPIAVLLMTIGDTYVSLTYISPVVFVGALVCTIWLAVKQLRYIKRYYPQRPIWMQAVLPAVALIALSVGSYFGDVAGAAHYNDPQDGFGLGATLGGILAAFLVYGQVIGNMIFIKTGGVVGTALQLLALLYKGVVWIVIAIGAWYSYALTYSFHDPTTE